MKKYFGLLMIALVWATMFTSCKKEASDPPTLYTTDPTQVTATTAISGGEILTIGSDAITAKGVCWSTNAMPTIANPKTTETGSALGKYVSNITGLTGSTTYHLRAYATNSKGTGYGDDVTFTTAVPAVLKTIIYGDEKWDFFYTAAGKIDYLNDYWMGALDKKLTYDYSVAGKLTLIKASDNSKYAVYDLDANGYITKSYSQSTPGNYERYVYDANGFMTEIWSYSAPGPEIKTVSATADGNNVTSWLKYSSGVVTQNRAFTYSTTDNLGKVHQSTIIDSPWKQVGNFYGKPSAKMILKFMYFNPTVLPIVEKNIPWVYTYDTKNRVSKATKTNYDLSTETWEYIYY